MKHAREDYNRFQDPLELIPKDEPVMLFRAQDKFAPIILLEYATLLHEENPEMSKVVINWVKEMIKWQQNIKIKSPDLKS